MKDDIVVGWGCRMIADAMKWLKALSCDSLILIPASNESSAVLARAFDECREGQIPRCSAALQA